MDNLFSTSVPDFLEQALSSSAPIDPGAPRKQGLATVAAGMPLDGAPHPDPDSALKDLAQQETIKRADAIIASSAAPTEKAKLLGPIAEEYHSPSEIAQHVAGHNAIIATRTDPDTLDRLRTTMADQQQQLQTRVDKARAWMASTIANAPSHGTVKSVEEVGEQVFDPTMYVDILNAMKDAGMKVEASDYVLPADKIHEWQRSVKSLPEDQAHELVSRTMEAIEKRSGLFAQSGYGAYTAMRALTDDMNDPEGKADNVMSILNWTLAGGPAIRGAAKLSKVILPAIRGGTASDALARTLQGADQLKATLASPNAEAALAKAGATPAEAYGSLAVTQVHGTYSLREGLQGYPTRFLTEAEEAAAKTRLSTSPTTATQLTATRDFDGGFDATVRHTTQDGSLFRSPEHAQAIIDTMDKSPFTVGEHKIIPVGEKVETHFNAAGKPAPRTVPSGYAIESTISHYYNVEDKLAFTPGSLKGPALLEGIFGKFTSFLESLGVSSTKGTLMSATAQVEMDKALKPLMDLRRKPGLIEPLLRVMDKHEGLRYLTKDDLIAEGLTDARQHEAYAAYTKTNQMARAYKGVRANALLVADGMKYAETPHGGAYITPISHAPSNSLVYDLATGNGVSPRSVKGGQFVRFAHAHQAAPGTDFTFGHAPDGWNDWKELPANPIPDIPGYLGRHQIAPVWIGETKSVIRNGSKHVYDEAIEHAPSMNVAAARVKALRAEFPNRVFTEPRMDRSFSGNTLQDLADMGQLITRRRGAIKPVTDALGNSKLGNVLDSIQSNVRKASSEAGLLAWGDSAVESFNKTFGRITGKFDVQNPLGKTPLNGVDSMAWSEARAMDSFIRRTAGYSRDQLNAAARVQLQKVANALFNVPVIGKTSVIQNIGLDMAKGFSGAGASIRKAATAVYVLTNFPRQAMLHSALASTFMAEEHGTAYALKGAWLRDFTALAMHGSSRETAHGILTTLGHSEQSANDFLNAWERSGYKNLVNEHAFHVSMGNNRFTSTGVVGQVVEGVVNAGKTAGIQLGLNVNKRAAFAVAYNRATKQLGRTALTQAEIDDVSSRAEQLTGGINRGDQLWMQRGGLNTFAQFLALPAKMTGRLLMQEKNLSLVVRARLAGYGFALFGTSFVGATNAATAIFDKLGIDRKKAQNTYDMVREGLAGYLYGHLTNTTSDVSERLSPVGFVGADLGLVRDAVLHTWNGGMGSLMADARTPPAAAIVGQFGQAVGFANSIVWKTDLPAPEKALAITARVLQSFPVTNNILKASIAYKTGNMVDHNGKPIYEAQIGDVWNSLAGIHSMKEIELNELHRNLFGSGQPAQNDALMSAMADRAREQVHNWMGPLLVSVGRGEANPNQAMQMLEDHTICNQTCFGDDAPFFSDAVMSQLHGYFSNKGDDLKAAIEKMIAASPRKAKLKNGQSLQDALKEAPDVPQAQQLLEEVERLIQNPDESK